mmetsp:Transcript_3540/g.12734  ORF Transcript_3540/g.12734 Transcript_3540/m.12734 type:complete len:311 (-) Transcript_3540:32-964(-)
MLAASRGARASTVLHSCRHAHGGTRAVNAACTLSCGFPRHQSARAPPTTASPASDRYAGVTGRRRGTHSSCFGAKRWHSQRRVAAASSDSDMSQRVASQYPTLPKGVPLFLGSGSRTRRELLGDMGYDFDICKADIDEKAIRREEPKELVSVLADAKATAVIEKMRQEDDITDGFLLTGDAVVVSQGRILEKPENEAEAREYIQGYSNSSCSVVGSILITDLKTGARFGGVDVSTVYFGEIPDALVAEMIAEGEVFYCAGGLMVEHPKIVPLVKRIDGAQDGVMGLRQSLVATLLTQAIEARAPTEEPVL